MLETLTELGLRGLIGGASVVAFSLVGRAVHPTKFAGIFAAAPAVAIAGLIMTLHLEDRDAAEDAASGMLLGGVAMVVYCAVAVVAVARFRALRGSLLSWVAWLSVAGTLYAIAEVIE